MNDASQSSQPLPIPKRWTTRTLIQWTGQYLARQGVDSPRLSAEMLLAHILEVDRLKLYMDPDRPASELERAAFRSLVERAAKHEPVDYLVGYTPFFTLKLKVSPDVLIPRPSTETIVEHILQHAKRTPGFRSPLIADIGTGSGAIAVTLTKHLPNARVLAVDISPKALDIARQNAITYGVQEQIDFFEGNLLEPVPRGNRLAYLVSNPPYIDDKEWEAVAPNVKNYEPHLALRGGVDGLRYLRPLIQHAHDYLQPHGQLVLEIASSQSQAILKLAQANPGLCQSRILADHEALPRVLVAQRVA